MAAQDPREESLSLEAILRPRCGVEEFFEEVWQDRCLVFPNDFERSSNPNDGINNQSPYNDLIENGWDAMVGLVENARDRYGNDRFDDADSVPLLFQNRQCSSGCDQYGNSLFHAYLDGNSVVLNHADWTCPYIARLCLDLQKSFPHAYANVYLTPPDSQAVPPHADDRDVLIIQVVGQKHWKVYENIPVPYPYPHEQAGKDGMEIPLSVLEGPCVVERVLKPGDVMYMPRGFVHEARTPAMASPDDDTLSYHVTVALATHDWTLAGLMTLATQHTMSRIIDYRKALPRTLGTHNQAPSDMAKLQDMIDNAFDSLRRQVTVDRVINNLEYKYENHNQGVMPLRRQCMRRQEQQRHEQRGDTVVVGRRASRFVTLDTKLRSATRTERNSVESTPNLPRGLNVRESSGDTVTTILRRFKAEPTLICTVSKLLSLLPEGEVETSTICRFTLLSFAKACVEIGALAIEN